VTKSYSPSPGAVANGASTRAHAPAPPDGLPAGLRYVDDSRPGFTRRKLKSGFAYFDLEGKRLRDARQIERINALAIPPAYENVWICPDPRGHVQATGRDARGRKQYRYHPRWRETRDATKYERMQAFGAALPKIRARVARDLKLAGMPREKVLATVVRLLDTTLIRIGSAEYARDNRSYGLTTLRKRHLDVHAGRVHFKFRGKSGIEHDVTVSDPRVARIVKRCMDLPGQDLFQYLDDEGDRHTVSSSDINDYLREISGADFTAKDYRTWAGSVFALAALREMAWETVAEARKNVVAIIKEVSALLRNTPAICRRCYVHPALLDAYHAGTLLDLATPPRRTGLRVDEAALALFLKRAEAAERAGRGNGARPSPLQTMLARSRQALAAAPGRKASAAA
jgi:DNA topoisomerase-1